MGSINQVIVDKLNAAPFNKSLSLVSFDEKTPYQLVELLNDVLAEISTEHKVAVKTENTEMTAQRICDFCWVLKYKLAQSDPFLFRSGIAQGDREVIYPLMHWLLPRIPELRKRAYLARFLVPLEVPPEVLNNDVYLQYKQRIDTFKEVHKTIDRIRSSGYEPNEMKRSVALLESEKEQLLVQIEKTRKKVSSIPIDELLAQATLLRSEKDEETKLAARLKEQKAQLRQSQLRHQRTVDKLKVMENNEGGPAVLLQRLQEEVKTNRYISHEKMPKEVEEKQKWVQQLTEVLHSERDEKTVRAQINKLRVEIKQLQTKRDALNNPKDEKLALFRQQATVVERKREEVQGKLNELQLERDRLEKEYDDQERAVMNETGGMLILKGEALDSYVQQLRQKKMVFKDCKMHIASLRTEQGVLARTEQILMSRDDNLKEFLAELEAKRGVQGYEETQEKIENISAAKEELDELKGKTLEEISKVVTQINEAIQDKRTKLAPLIKEMRELRQDYKKLEMEYTAKKEAYDKLQLALSSEISKLQEERDAHLEDYLQDESRYFHIHSENVVLDVELDKCHDDTFVAAYKKRTYDEELLSKELRAQQKALSQSHEPNIRQMKMFLELRKLLTLKLDLLKKQKPAAPTGREEVDRLVL